MDFEEKTIAQSTVFKGRIITLFHDDVRLPNGSETKREYVRHPGGVGIVPLDRDGNIMLVRQFRYPYAAQLLEIPAGKLSPGEEPLACGKRELQEETGVTAGTYLSLGTLYPSPAYTDEVIHLYLAEDLSFGISKLDEDEFLDVVKMPLRDAVKLVMEGKISDSKTQTALLKTWALTNGVTP